MYPQIDIRRYDPHLSPELAQLVTGTFSFTDLPHEIRVMRLKAIIEIYEAVKELGELEHTSDWDWRIEVLHAPDNGPATSVGTNDDRNVFADVMKLDYKTSPEDYLDHFARWQILTVEELSGETGDPTYVEVPIDEIRIIQMWYDT